MVWATRTIYTSTCVQMDPQQLPKMSKFYSICNKCNMQKPLAGGCHPPLSPLGSLKVKLEPRSKRIMAAIFLFFPFLFFLCFLFLLRPFLHLRLKAIYISMGYFIST